MTGIYAVGRLLWRPAMWLLLFPLFAATMLAVWDLPRGPEDVVDALRSGTSTVGVNLALWRLATLLPATAGLFLSFVVRELQHTSFAWTVPDLSRRLLLGKLAGAILPSLAAGALMARLGDLETGLAAFAWGLFCFALGGVAFDPVLTKIESRAAPTLVALAAIRPAYVEQLFRWEPLAFFVLAVAASLLLIRREFSRDISRMRPLSAVSGVWASTQRHSREYWAQRSAQAADWQSSLATDDLVSWLRAASYEAYAGKRGGIVRLTLVHLVVLGTVAYFFDMLHMVVILFWMQPMMSAAQLRTRFLYPLDRDRRAALFFVGTVAETVAGAALTAMALLILFSLGARGDGSGRFETLSALLGLLVFFVVWSPLGHWPKISEPWTDTASMSPRRAARFFGFLMAFVLLATSSAVQFQRLSTIGWGVRWIAAGFLTTAIYTTYWWAVRRHYRMKDLVVAPA